MRRWSSGATFPLSLAYLAAVTAADAIVGERAVLIGLLSLGPYLAAIGSTWPRTTVVAGFAVALAIPLGWVDGIGGTLDHVVRVTIVALAGTVAVAFARLRAEREEALRRIAHVAEVAQRAILRQPPSELGSVAMAARYLSASQEALVGGDLYETALTARGVRLIVGDVRGKGLDAVGVAASVLSTFRELVHQSPHLADLARAIDARLQATIAAEEFVTAVLVEVPERGDVTIVNCGHHPPLRIAGGESGFVVVGAADLPLGMGPGCTEWSVPLASGDRLLLYTDGLVEARDPSGREFDLLGHVAVLRTPELDAALDGLLDRLVAHVDDGLDDDLALLLAERLRR